MSKKDSNKSKGAIFVSSKGKKPYCKEDMIEQIEKDLDELIKIGNL